MQNHMQLQEAIVRIQLMEQYLDEVLSVMRTSLESVSENESAKAAIRELAHYYENGQWLQDYELDEKGMLPDDLKRGVLAQDTLYDVLGQMNEQSGK